MEGATALHASTRTSSIECTRIAFIDGYCQYFSILSMLFVGSDELCPLFIDSFSFLIYMLSIMFYHRITFLPLSHATDPGFCWRTGQTLSDPIMWLGLDMCLLIIL